MKKKFLALGLSLAMLITALTGCMVQTYDVKLEPDGSGRLVVTALLADEVLAMMGKTEEETFQEIPEGGRRVSRTVDGVPYSGVEMTVDFGSVAELEAFLSGEATAGEDTLLHVVPEIRDGKNLVTLYTTVLSEDAMLEDSLPKDLTESQPDAEADVQADLQLDEPALDPEAEGLFRFDMAVTFPEGVDSVSGLTQDCWTVEGNTATFHLTSGLESMKFSVTGVLGDAQIQPALANLAPVRTYTGSFTDVPQDAWYADELAAVYATGIVSGTSETTYAPQKPLTRAQVIAMAARLRAVYEGNPDVTALFAKKGSEPWYQPCLDYCIRTGMLAADTFDEYTVPATRGDMARVLSACLPEEELKAVNAPITFKDVPADHPWAESIGKLYCSGVTTGTSVDAFSPDSGVTRAQAAVFLSRILDPATRSVAKAQ